MEGKGQATIYVIIAVVIAAIIIMAFLFIGNVFNSIPSELEPVYNLYTDCLETETENGIDVLGTQGGTIDTGPYVPGSDFAPTASHLNFVGIQVPYWFYLTQNNFIQEQVPSKADMEQELEEFIESRVNDCDLTTFYEQGYYIHLDDGPEADVKIDDEKVSVVLSSDVETTRSDFSAVKTEHEVVVPSHLGSLHSQALEIYEQQRDEGFLEDYSIDILRLYAPVDGVEIQCAPETWQTQEVIEEIQSGLEANIAALKLEGDYYQLDEDDDDYFVIETDRDTEIPVNFQFSRQWPHRIEITPATETLMVAEPAGNQEGLGILGFCYVPYHFVYDLVFPVIIQLQDGQELFQFPVTVIIDNNLPREAELQTLDTSGPDYDVCTFKEGEATIHTTTFDQADGFMPVEADISYRCLDEICPLGKTQANGQKATLTTAIPVCFNGQVVARAPGYKEMAQQFSTNSETETELILEKEFNITFDVKLGGISIDPDEVTAIIHFMDQDDRTVSAFIPERETIALTEGLYDVEVYVYGNSGITIPSRRSRECFSTPKGGVPGLLGQTDEECIDIETPPIELDTALIGGGKTNTFILAGQLEEGSATIHASELPVPDSMEQLQYNHEVFDNLGVQVSFT